MPNPNQIANPGSNLVQLQNPIYNYPNYTQSPQFKHPSPQANVGMPASSNPSSTGNPPEILHEDITKKIQSNIQGLIQQLNNLQENLLFSGNNNYKNSEINTIKKSPGRSNIIKGGLVNDITPNISKKEDPIPPYPPLNTTFPSFHEIVEHPKFPPEHSDILNDKSSGQIQNNLKEENISNIHNTNILSSQKNVNMEINQPTLPDPNKIKMIEAIYQPL